MANYIIKICGIRDPDMAEQAAMAGANFIGLVFHSASPRCVNLAEASAISHATKKSGAKPVAVFVNHTAAEMLRICESADIQIVQLHGAIARAHHHLLPDQYQRIYVQTVSDKGLLATDEGLRYLDSERDFVLIDHIDSGQGKKVNWQTFRYQLRFPWMLAGGLTPTNVFNAISLLQPNGVDVSSGVESSKGNKDIVLIQQFIKSVRGYTHAA